MLPLLTFLTFVVVISMESVVVAGVKVGQITEVKWGRLVVMGTRDHPRVYKDAKIWPGGSREWDWNETKTRHSPGIQVADVMEILKHGVDYVVLSRGMQRQLKVPQTTIDYLTSQGVKVVVQPTSEAVEAYNQLLSQNKRVGGLFHSTC